MALAAVVLGYLWWTFPGVDPETVLILPLEVRGQEEGAEYLGRAFAEALAVHLVPGLLAMSGNPVLADSPVCTEALAALRNRDPSSLAATERLIVAFPDARLVRALALKRDAEYQTPGSP